MADDQNRTFPDQYMLRFPPGMRDRLKAVAKANSRSMNAEIVARLEESLAVAGAGVSIKDALDQVQAVLAESEAERAKNEEFMEQISRRAEGLLVKLKNAVGEIGDSSVSS